MESAPNAALVYTLAIGKDGRAADAYGEESQFIADRMAEAESVSARKATLFDSTGEDETIQVLRRRLFEEIDQTKARTVVDAYRCLWTAHGASLSAEATRPETVEAFLASYPLHPEVLETLTGNFRLRKPMNHEQFCRKPVRGVDLKLTLRSLRN